MASLPAAPHPQIVLVARVLLVAPGMMAVPCPARHVSPLAVLVKEPTVALELLALPVHREFVELVFLARTTTGDQVSFVPVARPLVALELVFLLLALPRLTEYAQAALSDQTTILALH